MSIVVVMDSWPSRAWMCGSGAPPATSQATWVWATMALSAGVHPKVVQERLGHANIGITLNVYSHVTAGLHDDAAEKVADLVFGVR